MERDAWYTLLEKWKGELEIKSRTIVVKLGEYLVERRSRNREVITGESRGRDEGEKEGKFARKRR